MLSWRGPPGPLAPGARGIAVDKEQPTGGAVGRTYLATERVLPCASPLKNRFATKRLAAIFIYADGCSLRLDHIVGDPPPRQVVLRTEAQFKKGIVRFRLRAVRRDSGEAWYQEAGRMPSGDVP